MLFLFLVRKPSQQRKQLGSILYTSTRSIDHQTLLYQTRDHSLYQLSGQIQPDPRSKAQAFYCLPSADRQTDRDCKSILRPEALAVCQLLPRQLVRTTTNDRLCYCYPTKRFYRICINASRNGLPTLYKLRLRQTNKTNNCLRKAFLERNTIVCQLSRICLESYLRKHYKSSAIYRKANKQISEKARL